MSAEKYSIFINKPEKGYMTGGVILNGETIFKTKREVGDCLGCERHGSHQLLEEEHNIRTACRGFINGILFQKKQ